MLSILIFFLPTGQMNSLSTILEFSPTDSKACHKRPVPFLDEVETDSHQNPSKKQKVSEIPSRYVKQTYNKNLSIKRLMSHRLDQLEGLLFL